jgi:superfamily II DNA helicase RecQ
MKVYIQQIESLTAPSFQQIRKLAADSISHFSQDERDKLWQKLNHGVDLLDSHELLCQYLWSFGNMHEEKMKTAFSEIRNQQNIFNQNITIVDWGCGQGLATVCFFDYLNQNHLQNKTKKVVLIEPSEMALERAKLHVNAYLKDENKIHTVNKYLDDVTNKDIKADTPIVLHFFSNILDIQNIDLKKLAQNVGENVVGEHYFFCVGPLNYGNNRIDAFYNYFLYPPTLANIEQSENTIKLLANAILERDEIRKYTLKLKVFKFESNKSYYVPIEYFPPVQFQAAYQLDCVKTAIKGSELKDKITALYNSIANFELAAPFDIGASIYDDVHPILAVLNNIVTRGLPTRTSPFIESVFIQFGNQKQQDDLGNIKFNSNINVKDLFLSLHLIDSRLQINESDYDVSLLDSDLEKEFITRRVPPYLQQLLQSQRNLQSITNERNHYSQRVDFACEFPYSEQNIKGFVIELDGLQYHQGEQQIVDRNRDASLNRHGWRCKRISENEIENVNYTAFEWFAYISNIKQAYDKTYNEEWVNILQLVLAPIAIARIQKTILEALMTGKISIDRKEWNVLVTERDVPCAAIAFEDLKQMFNHLTQLSKDYSEMKFPKINLEIISTKQFADSPLHLDNKPKPTITISHRQRCKEYDMVIDIAMLRRSNIENISFSEFKCKNDCYFNIRSAHYKRTTRHIYTSDTIEYHSLVTKDTQGNYKDIPETKAHLQYFLQLLFRKEDFRPGQLPILDRALQNKSVIGLLPTGGGKSLTYQLAAMLQPGVTLVIDPLRSLMKDQYDGLINAGIDTCTYINSTLDARERDLREKQMESSQMQFVFLSPERLCIYKFRERLKTMRDLHVYFAYGVIDEVHCVSEWGHDFRFSYLHLGRNLYKYVCPKNQEKHLTLFGLTATASFDVLADVERELSGNGAFPLDADTIVRYENTNRLELQYKIEKVDVEYEPDKFFDKNGRLDSGLPKAVNISDKWAVYDSKKAFLKEYIPKKLPDYVNALQTEDATAAIKTRFDERQNTEGTTADVDLQTEFKDDFYESREEYNQACIIFCPHKNSTGISVNVNADSLRAYNRDIGTFMGSGDDEDADEIDRVSFENLDKFRDNKLPLMVATKAFGMGIDKPNVRFTVNMNYSSSLESFVQEAGRAGRDRKTALATILFADYKLVRINKKCPNNNFPLGIIKNKWFKEEDLDVILQHYNISIDRQYFDYFTPQHDLVKLRCEFNNRAFGFNQCVQCPEIQNCRLSQIPQEARGFQYFEDLQDTLTRNGLEVPKRNLEYISADYETVMYFYNNNFKGSLLEKQTMYELLSKSNTDIFLNDNVEINTTETVSDFLKTFLSVPVGTEVVAFVSAKTVAKYQNKRYFVEYQNKTKNVAGLQDENNQKIEVELKNIEILREKADIAKAIYRLCSIELINDFTEDYANKCYRIVAVRKTDGEYYQGLKRFLMRYYSADRAEEEIQKVPNYKGENEIHKCLGYLTEFVYDKIAVKRKRAIDDMRTFCIQGLDNTKDWKEVNEDLKDFIYYYFNSKYAKKDYQADNGEYFSLTDDTVFGKNSNIEFVFKYMRVIDNNLVGAGGTPKDNVKHLQGAVRLIRRSLTDINPALDLLNAFCLFYLGTNNNETLENELRRSYQDGLIGFSEIANSYTDFWDFFENFHNSVAAKARAFPVEQFNDIKEEVTAATHANIIRNLTNKYIEI